MKFFPVSLWVSRLPAVSFLLVAAVLSLFSSCSEGTSSGWDNPSMTVSFVDAAGAPQKISGELELFAADQNPAVDPFPLTRVRFRNATDVQLTRNDFERGQAALDGNGAAPLDFNLVLAGDSGTGALAMGLRYFSGSITSEGAPLAHLEMKTLTLTRYGARLLLQTVHGNLGRVYVPGTAYQATLDEGGFTFEALPEERLPLKLLNSEGYIFAVKESLDTRIVRVYTPTNVPSESLPGSSAPQAPLMGLKAGPDRETFVGAINSLEAGMLGVDSGDARLSVLWRQIGGRDTVKVKIGSRTWLKTSVTFNAEGIYQLEVNATLLKSTVRDTLLFSVRSVTTPTRLFVSEPKAGDTLIAGQAYGISWEIPAPSPVTILFSSDGGAAWDTLAQHYLGSNGLPVFLWTPPLETSVTTAGLIEVSNESDGTWGRTEGLFSIIKVTPGANP